MAIDIIKQQLVMIANAMIMKALGVQHPAPGCTSKPTNTTNTSATRGHAQGDYVDQPTRALIGESGPEYVIPASKLDSAMQKYAAGQRGSDHAGWRVS